MSNLQHYFGASGWPTCAVCNKPVEKLESMHHPLTYAMVFRAFCHGQTDEAILTHEEVENSHAIKFSWAFDTKQLEQKNV